MARFTGTNGNDILTVGYVTGQSFDLFMPNDFFNFGIGADSLTGGSRTDIFHLKVDAMLDRINGGSGVDRVDYGGADRAVTVTLAEGSQQGSVQSVFHKTVDSFGRPEVVKVATLTGIEDVTGSKFADTIRGNSLLNTLDGGKGNDTFVSKLDGKADVIKGGDGVDTIDYSTMTPTDGGLYIWMGNGIDEGYTYGSVLEDRLIDSIEIVIGSRGDDEILGNSASNTIKGGGGDDEITAYWGRDRLTGGAGNDTFRYEISEHSDTDYGVDKILDFEFGADKIDIAEMIASYQPDLRLISGNFTGEAGEVRATRALGSSLWQINADLDGDRITDFTLDVQTVGRGVFQASDFIL